MIFVIYKHRKPVDQKNQGLVSMENIALMVCGRWLGAAEPMHPEVPSDVLVAFLGEMLQIFTSAK